MATNNKVPYAHGGPVPRIEPEPAPAPETKSCSSCPCGKGAVGVGIIFVCVVVVIGVFYILRAPISAAHSRLESKQISELHTGLGGAISHKRFAEVEAANPNASGEVFWSTLLQSGVLDDSCVRRLVSLRTTTDAKASISDGLPSNSCSYTGPKLSELKSIMGRAGEERCILLTFNARNWNNYPEEGVIVLWSDGVVGEWLTFDEASENYGITAEEWADPAGKLFGKKAPFQHTYE